MQPTNTNSLLGAGSERFWYEPVKTFVYKETPQGALEMQVHLPYNLHPGLPPANRAAIVFFFGGGWKGGTTRQFARQATYLAGRGMIAAIADYRVQSRHGVTPDVCVEDAKSAVRWLRQHANELCIDPARLVGSGGSAGAHLAACTALVPGFDAPGDNRSISTRPAGRPAALQPGPGGPAAPHPRDGAHTRDGRAALAAALRRRTHTADAAALWRRGPTGHSGAAVRRTGHRRRLPRRTLFGRRTGTRLF